MRTTIIYLITFLLFIFYKSSQQNARVNKPLQVKELQHNNTVSTPFYTTRVAEDVIFLSMIYPGIDNTRITTVGKMPATEAYLFDRITQ